MSAQRWSISTLVASLVVLLVLVVHVALTVLGPPLHGEHAIGQAYVIVLGTIVGGALSALLFLIGVALAMRHRLTAGAWPTQSLWLAWAVLVLGVMLAALIAFG